MYAGPDPRQKVKAREADECSTRPQSKGMRRSLSAPTECDSVFSVDCCCSPYLVPASSAATDPGLELDALMAQ